MERWLLTVESNCSDPLREKDFNDWYDREFVLTWILKRTTVHAYDEDSAVKEETLAGPA